MIRDESNTDFADRKFRESYRPPNSITIAIQRLTSREKETQVLVEDELKVEQERFSPNPVIQDHPGERVSIGQTRFEKVFSSDPEKFTQPSKTPVMIRSTVSSVLKRRMGRPVMEGRVKYRKGIEGDRGRGLKNAFGLDINEKVKKNTPVRNLNFVDKFFNIINVFFA